jgi:hypothetical protein
MGLGEQGSLEGVFKGYLRGPVEKGTSTVQPGNVVTTMS